MKKSEFLLTKRSQSNRKKHESKLIIKAIKE